MKIEVLGPGCPKCEKLLANTQAAVKKLGIAADIQKVTDITQFMKYGVMLTPALVVDGNVKVAGRVPGVEDIKKFLA